MVKEISYSTISNVMEDWESVKRTKDYEKVAGTKLFRRLFDKCPQAKLLFGFPIDIDVDSPELLQSKRFIAQAIYFWNMIDTSLNMLGPDIELLTEIMTELGTKHVVYGVKPDMFPIMGDALVWTLKEMLGDKFTEESEESWKETYGALSADMIRSMVSK
ncbi:hypothetical protein FisN_24Lh015 [Fistulifera solaris]|uniref:Globin domain-containing protein n=1 Tax=Fistulifera solaris TaxID=1519565 RepID=A0A1Z5KTA3_FISSO|nr:hypothetical protein FisN_24Lh015 [Fistulifera solaris]|eukprot:GAX29564.1 hypothetical protein FisN_24Lh015 [Fistulifera solaris]